MTWRDLKLKPLNNKTGGQGCASHDCSQAAARQHCESLEIAVFVYGMSHSVLISAEKRAISRCSNRQMIFLSLEVSRYGSGDAATTQK